MNLDAVRAWMDAQGLGSGPLADVRPIGGGTQNVMIRFSRDGREYVLRRGPEHLRPGSNTVIAREFEVLRALGGTDVPHPHLIATCDDTSVLGDAVFYLMEPVDGFNASLELPDAAAGTPELRRQLGFALVDALATEGIVASERDSNLRVSLHLYNTDDDVDAVLAALKRSPQLLR